MAINLSFGGGAIRRPGAYSTVDTSNMIPITLGGFKTLAFIGTVSSPVTATLVPGTVAYFNDQALARAAIGDCDLLKHMQIAWKHGADLIAVSMCEQSGSEGAEGAYDYEEPTISQWQDAIDALQDQFVDGIVPVTTDAAVHALLDTHVTLLSSVINRKERRAFYGHETGLDTTAITALQTALSNERALIASPCPYEYDGDGIKTLYPSTLLSAAIAGTWAGLEEEEPITYKYVKFPEFEKRYSNTDILALLDGHICPVEYVKNKGFRIVQGLTASADEDLTKCELSVSTLKDVMSRNMREYMENKYVGKAGVDGIATTILNDAITMIEKFLDAGWITDYVRDSVVVRQDGTTFWIDWEGKPTLPINNFLITAHFTL